MKYNLSLLLTLISFIVYSQTEIKLFYNEKGELTDSVHATAYRFVVIDENNLDFHGNFSDYTIEKNLLRKGSFSHKKLHGDFECYYLNGNIKCKGNYSVGYRNGEWNYFFENGQLQYKVIFGAGNPDLEFKYNFSVLESYNKNGEPLIINGTGLYVLEYQENGTINYINENYTPDTPIEDIVIETEEVVNTIKISGKFSNGKKVGTWRKEYSVEKYFNLEEEFKNDTFSSGIKRYEDMGTSHRNEYYKEEQINKFPDFNKGNFSSINSMRFDTSVFQNNLLIQNIDVILTELTGKKFEVKNRNAGFEEGDYELEKLIAKKIKYPIKAKNKGIEGTIYFTLTINKEGKMIDFQKMNSIHPDLDKEAEKVISSITEGWLPAIRNGVVVKEKILVTVSFELN